MRSRTTRAQRLRALALVLGVTFGNAEPLRAAALGGSAPVRIDGCTIVERTYLADPFNSMRTNLVSGVAVRFVNVGRAAATRVRIAVRYQGSTASIVERGAFTAGDAFERTAAAFTGDSYAGATAECAVTSVDFVEGSTWTAAP